MPAGDVLVQQHDTDIPVDSQGIEGLGTTYRLQRERDRFTAFKEIVNGGNQKHTQAKLVGWNRERIAGCWREGLQLTAAGIAHNSAVIDSGRGRASE